MEALAAIGVASAVVQFVDFGSKVFFKSVELYKSTTGSLCSNVELSSVVEDLSQISAGLARTVDLRQEQLTNDELALNKLALQCNMLANELTSDLQRLIVKNPNQKWETLYTAIKAVWKEKKIQETQQRLSMFRSQLTIHLVAVLRYGAPR